LVKVTASLRKLAYGTACDREEEVFEISESVLNDTYIKFANIVREIIRW
jgi:hypothetical protein